jgi:hypothetical protein
MKYSKYAAAMALLMFAVAAFAQHGMDSAAERAVHITQGPRIIENSGTSAMLEWDTDRQAANRVQYRRAGAHEAWKTVYHPGGGKHHQLRMTGLRPGDTYEYEILTRDGDVRTRGEFRANGQRRDNDHDRDDRRHHRDHDKDHDKDHDRDHDHH